MKNRNLKHSDNWKTPTELYEKLNSEFKFNFDPCPYSEGEPLAVILIAYRISHIAICD